MGGHKTPSSCPSPQGEKARSNHPPTRGEGRSLFSSPLGERLGVRGSSPPKVKFPDTAGIRLAGRKSGLRMRRPAPSLLPLLAAAVFALAARSQTGRPRGGAEVFLDGGDDWVVLPLLNTRISQGECIDDTSAAGEHHLLVENAMTAHAGKYKPAVSSGSILDCPII